MKLQARIAYSSLQHVNLDIIVSSSLQILVYEHQCPPYCTLVIMERQKSRQFTLKVPASITELFIPAEGYLYYY